MFKIKNIFGLTVIVFIILASIIFSGKIIYPKMQLQNQTSVEPADTRDDKAPEITNTGKWINTDKSLSLEDLKGKVVLIEFWTFGCYNCRNTIPYINQWYEKYKSDKFEIVGVHCPEFDNERNFENVKEGVRELEIKYPVVTDNEFTVWDKYDVHAWPTMFLIDKKGEIRYKHIGEGSYRKTEEMIQALMKEM